jgi:hypothetical protein
MNIDGHSHLFFACMYRILIYNIIIQAHRKTWQRKYDDSSRASLIFRFLNRLQYSQLRSDHSLMPIWNEPQKYCSLPTSQCNAMASHPTHHNDRLDQASQPLMVETVTFMEPTAFPLNLRHWKYVLRRNTEHRHRV